MKKKLIIGGIILALIVGIAVWATKGEEIKEKAVEKAVEAVVEKVVEEAVEDAKDKLIKEAVGKLIP
jgi:hypothetical protein|tara:strand:+ start:106 stop:306 length:201 start_codon:yes stop_codon:yes gene_type:complete